MNEHEKKLLEKRKQLENELMIDRILNNNEEPEDFSEAINSEQQPHGELVRSDSLDKRNRDFLMENFFKVYDKSATREELT